MELETGFDTGTFLLLHFSYCGARGPGSSSSSSSAGRRGRRGRRRGGGGVVLRTEKLAFNFTSTGRTHSIGTTFIVAESRTVYAYEYSAFPARNKVFFSKTINTTCCTSVVGLGHFIWSANSTH